MATCRKCGAILPEGTKYCSECGAPVESASGQTRKKPKKKFKMVFIRLWLCAMAIIIVAGVLWRGGLYSKLVRTRQSVPTIESTVSTPKPTTKPTAKPTEAPEETEAPEAALAEADIRPEVKEALDSYEAYMDEYIAFMERYKAADASDMAAMMGDYMDMLSRYSEFAEKIDALGESELTNAELAYYIEVTNRVSQKLLNAAG